MDNGDIIASGDDIIERADAFDKESEGFKDVIDDLLSYNAKADRIDRKRNIGLASLAIVVLVLSVVVGQVYRNTRSSAQNKNLSHELCVATNNANSAQTALWTFLFSFPVPPNQTPEEAQKVVELKALVADRFKQVPCP